MAKPSGVVFVGQVLARRQKKKRNKRQVRCRIRHPVTTPSPVIKMGLVLIKIYNKKMLEKPIQAMFFLICLLGLAITPYSLLFLLLITMHLILIGLRVL